MMHKQQPKKVFQHRVVARWVPKLMIKKPIQVITIYTYSYQYVAVTFSLIQTFAFYPITFNFCRGALVFYF